MVWFAPPLFCRTIEPELSRPETVPEMPNTPVTQLIATLVTLADAVPLPFVTEQVCCGVEGCVSTVTAYAPPLLIGAANVKLPLALTVKLAPALFCSTTLAPVARPVSVPPMVYVTGGGRVGDAVDRDVGDVRRRRSAAVRNGAGLPVGCVSTVTA